MRLITPMNANMNMASKGMKKLEPFKGILSQYASVAMTEFAKVDCHNTTQIWPP